MIDKDALCFHCKSLLSDITEVKALERYIGFLSSLDEPTYIKYCKEVSYLISIRLQGESRYNSLKPEEISHIPMKRNKDRVCYVDVDGSVYEPTYIPRDKTLSELLHLDGNIEPTHFVWAAMMKLSRAVPPKEGRPSKAKLKEHIVSITDPYSGSIDILSSLETSIRVITRMLIQHSDVTYLDRERFYLPITHFPAVDKSFTCLSSDGLKAYSKPRTSLEPFNLKGLLRHHRIQDLYQKDPDTFISRAFVGTRIKNGSFDLSRYPRVDEDTPLSIIGFIPNPGDKQRVVASSNSLVQSLSYPIGKVVKKINSSWKVQGVKSHKDTCDFIHSLLSRNNGRKTFYSIDMSNFTDRLPYNGLISVIVDELVNAQVLYPFDKDLMDLICEGPILLDNQIRYYGVGTPMGTFPSFPLASLANGVIATISYVMAHHIRDFEKLDLDRVPARIIGDDIVIWDKKTAQIYEFIMEEIGLEVQPSKCLISAYAAEMCSKIITNHGVFQQKKIDSLYLGTDVQSFVEQYRYYEDELLIQLHPEMEGYIETLKKIPNPIGLAPSIDDFSNNYWEDHTTELQLYTAIKVAHDFKASFDLQLDALDFELLRKRRKLLPSSLKYELEESYEPYQHSPVIESLLREMQVDISIILGAEAYSLEEKLDASERVIALGKAFSDTYHYRSIEDIESIRSDFHLHDPSEDCEETESGLILSQKYKSMIDSLTSIHDQIKEVIEDDRTDDIPVSGISPVD